jgi:patatin-like phospholipase/acyl hydrolase
MNIQRNKFSLKILAGLFVLFLSTTCVAHPPEEEGGSSSPRRGAAVSSLAGDVHADTASAAEAVNSSYPKAPIGMKRFYPVAPELADQKRPYSLQRGLPSLEMQIRAMQEKLQSPQEDVTLDLQKGLSSLLTQVCALQESPRKVRVLSMDGGGVRGIFHAYFLKNLCEVTGKKVHELFDVVVGTSAGGIIALAVTMENNMSPDEIIDMLSSQELLGRMFKSKYAWLTNPGGIRGAFYDRDSIDRVFSEKFQESRLSKTKVPVGVVAVDRGTTNLKVFRSDHAQKSEEHDVHRKDAAGATSAATPYWDPKQVGEKYYEDGGFVANDPASIGIEMAQELFGENAHIQMVSLGTGAINNIPTDIDSSTIATLRWLSQTAFPMQIHGVEWAMRALAKRGAIDYFRFNPSIKNEISSMDDYSPKNMAALLVAFQEALGAGIQDVTQMIQRFWPELSVKVAAQAAE